MMKTILLTNKLFVFFTIVLGLFSQTVVAQGASDKVLHVIDFSQQPNGNAEDWLKKNGFIFALDGDELNPRFEDKQLVISTNEELAGIIGIRLEDGKYLHDVERVKIEWSVSRYSQGANWEEGNNRVAVAVMVFFGTEKLSSGLPFGINSAPYFFSPFIGRVEPAGKMYLGKLYKKGGRYFSVIAPDPVADVFTTDFEVNERFRKIFNKTEVPPITAVAFQMNTKDTTGGATASIRRISFIAP